VRPGAAYLVTGGLGGLGLTAARALAQAGAGRIVLSGRSAPTGDAETVIGQLRAQCADLRVVTGDITEPPVAARLVAEAIEHGTPLRGVIHAAGVLADAVATRLDAQTVEAVFAPKSTGTWQLHEATKDHDLDWFAVFSSAAALLGSAGQTAYAAANSWADAFVAWRRAAGLPGISIAWGPWARVGLARNVRDDAFDLMEPEDGALALGALLTGPAAHVAVARLHPAQFLRSHPELRALPFFADLLAGTAEPRDSWPGPQALTGQAEQDRLLVAAQLAERVGRVMGFADARPPDDAVPLTAIGLDSLTAVRIKNAVTRDFGVAVPVALLLQGVSLSGLRDAVLEQLGITAREASAVPERARQRAQLRRNRINRERP
jgi:phthiocerol/phenolphthiocerol synthesis type-I polyketide synthase D